MQNLEKDWLVRTRTREILGPFTQNELYEQLQRRTFSSEDEICPSRGHWVSAQGLSTREREEYTLTSTRTHTATRSTMSSSLATAPAAETFDDEELTPTPDFGPRSVPASDPKKGDPGEGSGTTPVGFSGRGISPRMVAFVVGITLFAFAIWSAIAIFKRSPAPKTIAKHSPPTYTSSSAFIQSIYGKIERGEKTQALKELVDFHEHGDGSDLEHLIPYGALLIQNKESIPRGTELLEEVLNNDNAPFDLKAEAHRWLGYAMLQNGEGDLGEGHFLEALQLNPRDSVTQFNLGRSYLMQQKYSNALEYLSLSELQHPDLWLIHIYKGRTKVSMEQIEEARKAFKTAIGVAPDRWISYVYYALFLHNLKDFEGAQEELMTMLSRDPSYEIDSPPPFGFFQEGVNYSDYWRAFGRIMEKSPPDKREWGRLYLGYLMHGPNGPEVRKIDALAEKGNVPLKLLALKVKLDKNTDLSEVKRILVGLPQNLDAFGCHAYVLRAQAKAKLGNLPEAIRDLQAAVAIEPRNASANLYLARYLKETDHRDEALGILNNLLGYHPQYIPAIVSTQ